MDLTDLTPEQAADLTDRIAPQLDRDLFRLYFDWVGRFNELHWQVLRVLRHRAGLTRKGIWLAMGGRVTRDDSAEADVFGCLIKDLTFAHLLHQQGEKAPTGQTYKPSQAPTGRRVMGRAAAAAKKPPSPYRKSPFDDFDPYELTSGGKRFVDAAWQEVGPKIVGPSQRPTTRPGPTQ